MLYPLHLTHFISNIFELANQIKVLTDSTNQSIDKYPSRQTYLPAGVSVSDPYPEPPFSEKLDTAPY